MRGCCCRCAGWCATARCAGTLCPAWAKVSRDQADARALMTGRITDAYTNIATVKLFSATHREAEFARAAMDAFGSPAMRRCAW